MANVKAVIDVDINTSSAAAGLRSLQGQFNAFAQTLNTANASHSRFAKETTQQLAGLVNATQFFTAETVKMRTSASQLDLTLAKGGASMGQFFSARFRKDGLAAAQVMSLANVRASAMQTQFIATGTAANGMRDALAIRPLQAFNSVAVVSAQKLAIHRAMLNQSTTSLINFGKNTQWAGRQLMVGFTVPLTIFAGVAGKVFRDLEKEAVNFRKVYGDIFTTDVETEQALQGVRDLSKEFTRYGVEAKKTMQLAAIAAQAGQQGAQLMAATTQATRLSVLGDMENQDAMRTTIALQSAFKMSNEELAESINFLNMVENSSVLALQDVADAIPRVAPVIQGLGGDVKDLAVMLVAMREGGVSAAEAANGLKSSLGRLITPSKQARDMATQFGINLEDIVQKNAGNVLQTVSQLATEMQGLADLDQQKLLSAIFGKFQYARIGALFENITREGSQAQKVIEMMGMSTADMAATAEKELSAIESSVATKFTASIERMKLAIAPIGEMFVKMALPIVNFLAKVAEGFNNLPDFAKNFLALGAAIVGIVIPAGTMFAGLLMNLIGTLVKVGHLIGLAFKGFLSGGLAGAINNVSQALNYMSLEELDTTIAATQMAGATEAANKAFVNQVGATAGARAAINQLAISYDIIYQKMMKVASANAVAFGPGVAAMGAAAGPATARAAARGVTLTRLNKGGTAPGTGNKDTVPAMLTPGEFVINKKSTQENLPLLHAINDGQGLPGFNKGGRIPGVQYAMAGRLITTQKGLLERLRALQGFDMMEAPRTSQVRRLGSNRTSDAAYQQFMAKNADGKTKNARVVKYAVEQLGISPADLGLSSRGNFGFALSPQSNSAMVKGTLTRQALIDDIKNPNALNPLQDQLERYFKVGVDREKFTSIFENSIKSLPVDSITNKRFEQSARRALYQYLRSEGIPKEQAGSFMKNILSRTEISSNLRLERLQEALALKGITPMRGQGRKDLYVNHQGEQLNLGRLLGQEIGSLDKPSDIARFTRQRDTKSLVPRGMVFAHANKGGMIPGMQYLSRGGPAMYQNLGKLISLFTTRGGLPGASMGREAINKRFLEDSRRVGLEPKKFDLSGSLTGAGKRGSFIPGLSLQRGHVASTIKGAEGQFHPGMMFWQTKKANLGLSKRGLTGQQLLEDFVSIEKKGMYPASLMTVGAQELGLSSKQIQQIDRAYLEIKRQLMLKKNQQRIFKDSDFTNFTENILRKELDKNAFDALYNIGTLRSKETKKSIASISFQEFQKSGLNQGGMIPGGRVDPSRGLYGVAPQGLKLLQSYMAGNFSAMESAKSRKLIMGLARPMSGTFFRGTQLGSGAVPKHVEKAMREAEKTGDFSGLIGKRFKMRASDWSSDKKTATRFATMNQTKNKKDFLLYEKGIAEREIRKESGKIADFESGRTPWFNEKQISKSRSNLSYWQKDLVRVNKQLEEIGDLSPLMLKAQGRLKGVPASQLVPDATYMGRPISENNVISTSGMYEIRNASKGNLDLVPVQSRNMGGPIFESARKTIVPGVGNTDTVPAALTPGEFVVNKKATQQNLGLLHSINSGQAIGMNMGGGVAMQGRMFYGRIDQEIRKMMTAFGSQGVRISKEEAALYIKQGIKVGEVRKGILPQRGQTPAGGSRMGGMRGMGASMGMAMGGMGVMMLGQKMEQQAMERGETSGIGGLLSTGGIGLSMASILPFLPHAKIIAGFVALGGSMAALVMGANKLQNAFTETNQAMQGSADRAEKFAEAFGRTTNVQQLTLSRAQNIGGGITEESYEAAGKFMESEAGKTLLSDLRLVQKIGKEQSEALVNQLKRSILAGAITTEEARSIAIQTGQALKNETLAITVSAELDNIFGPEGKKLDRGRLAITSTLIPEFDIKELEKETDIALRAIGKVDWSKGFDLGAAGMTMITLGGTFITEGQKTRAMLNAMADQTREVALIEKEARAAVTLEYQQGIITLEEYTSKLRRLFDMNMSGEATTRYLEGVGQIFSQQQTSEIPGRRSIVTAEDIRNAPLRRRSVDPQTGARLGLSTRSDLNVTSMTGKDFAKLSEEQIFKMDTSQINTLISGIESSLSGFSLGGNILTELEDAQNNLNKAKEQGDRQEIKNAEAILQSKQKELDQSVKILNFADKLLKTEKARKEAVDKINASTVSLLEKSGLDEDQIQRLREISGILATPFEGFPMPYGPDTDAQTMQSQEIFQAFATGDFNQNTIKLLVEMADRGTLANLIPDNIQDKVGFLKELGLLLGTFAAFPDLQEKMLNVIINDPQNGREIVREYEDTFIRLQRLPKDVTATFKINMETPEGLDAAKGILPGIEKLMPMFDVLDGEVRTLSLGLSVNQNGKPIPLSQAEKNVAKIQKTLKELDSTNPVIRRLAMIEYMTMLRGEDGEEIQNPETALKRLEEKFPGKIRNLPTVVFKQVAALELEVAGLDEEIAILEALGQGSLSPDRAEYFFDKARSLKAAKKAMRGRQRAMIQTAQSEKSGTSGGGGGGGGTKPIIKQLQEEFKALEDFYKGLSKYINSKTGDFEGAIAGPFGPAFIEYLRSQGEEGLKILKGSTDKLKKVYAEFIKVQQQQTANFIQTLPANFLAQARATQGETIVRNRLAEQGVLGDAADTAIGGLGPETLAAYGSAVGKRRRNAQRKKGTRKGKREGLTSEEQKAFQDIQGLITGPTGAAAQEATLAAASDGISEQNRELNQLQAFAAKGIPSTIAEQLIAMSISAKDADKTKFQNIIKGLEEIEKRQNIQNISKAFEEMGKDIKGTMSVMAAIPGASQETIDKLKGMGDMSLLTSDDIKQLNTQLIMMEAAADAARPALDRMGDVLDRATGAMQADIEKINRLEIRPLEMDISRIQKEMNPYQDEIKRLEKLIKPLNKEIENFNEQIETQQRLIRPLSKDIEKLREEEDELNKHYDERSRVLDQVSRVNEKVIAQQRGQLDIASALSRGDIAGAAKATRELQATMAQQRMDDAKEGLEKEREDKRLEITTQIEAKEKEIKAINDQIELIQEKIETRQDSINEYTKLIAAENDKIALKQEQIEDIQKRIELSKERQLALEERIYKSQLLQSMLATQRQITEDARLGRTEAVQFGLYQLSAQQAVAGGTPEERARFFEGIPGGSEVTALAGQTLAKTPEQIVAELMFNIEDFTKTLITNLREKIVDPLDKVHPEIDAILTATQLASGEFKNDKTGLPYTTAEILESMGKAGLDFRKFLGDKDNLGVLGTNLQSTTDSVQETANSFAVLPGLAISARQSFEAMVKALDGKIGAAREMMAAAERSIKAAQEKPAAAPAATGKNRVGSTFGGVIKKAFGGMISYKGSTERAPGMAMGGKMKRYATGAFVPGTGITDSVPALLTPGEFVVRKSVAQAYGPMLESLNSQVYPEFMNFATGGFAGNMGSMTKASSQGMFPSFKSIVSARSFPTMSGTGQKIKVGSTRGTAQQDGVNVEYNYSVNVNAETNSSPDDIANAVIHKFRRMESRQVKGTRIG